MLNRLAQLTRRLGELEEEIAQALREYTASVLESLARAALSTGEVSDQDLEETILDQLQGALLAVYTAQALDVTQRIGTAITTIQIRSAIESVLQQSALQMLPSARVAIAETVAEAFKRNWSVERTARQLRKYITLAPSQVTRLRSFAEDLRRDPIGAAKEKGFRLAERHTQGDLNRLVERFRVQLERDRALAVARHEIWRASQAAEHAIWVEAVERGEFSAGSVTKHWNDQADGHVRSSHRDIAERYPQGLGLQEAFVTTRGLLMYPLDPRGSAENVIGCRCWLTYRVGGETR